jgi:maleylpyruvate isomerase
VSTVGGMDPVASLGLVRAATERVLAAASALADAEVAAPSVLPGWSRGHTLTHLARNADGLRNLLVSARTGERLPMYDSAERRNGDIEAGSGRSPAELITDLTETHRRFMADAERVGDWSATVSRTVDGPGFPAWWVPLLRLGELEIHHTDLDVGYGIERWPADWVGAYLPYASLELADRAGEPIELRATDTGARVAAGDAPGRTVEGPSRSLLAWVIGRHDGHDLRTAPDGPLPVLGTWR